MDQHFIKNGRYYNPNYTKQKLSLKQVFHSIRQERRHLKPPDDFLYPNPKQPIHQELPSVTWLNHSSFHVACNQIHCLTDPIWSKRCSPLPFLGPKRKHALPKSIHDFNSIHFVLISHNHYDHLDRFTVCQLHCYYPQIHWIVPRGVAFWFHKLGIKNVHELSWGEQVRLKFFNIPLQVTATPAQHFSGRGLTDRNRSLWNSYVVSYDIDQRKKQLYFVGDTGYNPDDFKMIGQTYGPMDLSLIPIGAYYPRFFMKEIHVNPEEAVWIHQEVQSKLSIGMHWKTFKLTTERMDQPPYDLFQALKKYAISPNDFRVLEIGQKINWSFKH